MKTTTVILLLVLSFVATAALAQDPPVTYTPITTTTAAAPAPSPALPKISQPFVAPSPASAWEKEPTAYRDVPFGATLEEAKAKGILTKCTLLQKHWYSDPGARVGETWCESTLTLTNDIKLAEHWGFKNNRLYNINVTFPMLNNNYADMKTILVEKYGNQSEEVQGKLGRVDHWNGNAVTLEYGQYFVEQTDNGGAAAASLLGALVGVKPISPDAQAIIDANKPKTYVPVTGYVTFYVINHEEDAATKDKTKAAASKF